MFWVQAAATYLVCAFALGCVLGKFLKMVSRSYPSRDNERDEL